MTSLRERIAAFQRPGVLRSGWQLFNTLIPFAILWALAAYALQYSFWLMLPVTLLNSGFLIRTFIIFHDCGHQSFFRSRRANDFWGIITGIITFTPYYYWHANHARHHATSGNLDKRGHGDVWMLTVEEFMEAPPKEQWKYRLYRHPLIMFLLGPLLIALVSHRIVKRKATRKERLSVYGANVGIVVLAVTLGWIMGWQAYLIIQVFTLYFGLLLGVWLFYVQHQFEDVYWARQLKWDFVTASLEGGSFYQLPAVIRWFTGSIGYHHVHHLNPRIPNYQLAKCHDEIPELNAIRPVRLFSSLKSLTYRLWDEDTERMVGFREARKLHEQRTAQSVQ